MQSARRKQKKHLHNLADEVMDVLKMGRTDDTYIKKIILDTPKRSPSIILYHDHMIQGYSFEKF